jgi:hypothetical protein
MPSKKEEGSTESKNVRVFMISPIGDPGDETRLHADMVFNSIVRNALPSPEFTVTRADQFAAVHMITDKVIAEIEESALCVCDLSFHNPNVFYELGLRHTLAKPVILLAKIGTKLPFDTSGFATIFFNLSDWNSHVLARNQVRDAAKEILSKDHKVSNPITQARASLQLSKSVDSRDRLLSEAISRIQVLEASVREQNARLTPTLSSGLFGIPRSAPSPWSSYGVKGLLDDISSMPGKDLEKAIQGLTQTNTQWSAEDLVRGLAAAELAKRPNPTKDEE